MVPQELDLVSEQIFSPARSGHMPGPRSRFYNTVSLYVIRNVIALMKRWLCFYEIETISN